MRPLKVTLTDARVAFSALAPGGDMAHPSRMRAALEAQLVEEETEARVAAAVEARVASVMASEAVQATLTARLQAERRVLEEQARPCMLSFMVWGLTLHFHRRREEGDSRMCPHVSWQAWCMCVTCINRGASNMHMLLHTLHQERPRAWMRLPERNRLSCAGRCSGSWRRSGCWRSRLRARLRRPLRPSRSSCKPLRSRACVRCVHASSADSFHRGAMMPHSLCLVAYV